MKNYDHEAAMIDIYRNPPATVAEQIAILKLRGMKIKNEVLATEFLNEVYFHRFVSYSVPFFSEKNSKFYRPGTTFEQVVAIYDFDSQLRLLILSAIEKIEISVRTQFINLSWKYGPHFYLNHKLFRDHRQLNDSIERIQYQVNASNDLLVNEYYHRYHHPDMPPIWIALEVTSIGQLSKWLRNLKRDEDKQMVAHRYQIHYSMLQATLDNLALIRNYAAHHIRIWNQHYNFSECVADENHPQLSRAMANSDRIYNVLLLITYLLMRLGVHQVFYQRLNDLIDKYQIKIESMGFPSNWREIFQGVIDGK